MRIKELVKIAHKTAIDKGFWENEREFGTLIALIHSEASEALEAHRKEEDNIGEELADIVIRVADLAGGYNIDLEWEVAKKMDYNLKRPYKHGKQY